VQLVRREIPPGAKALKANFQNRASYITPVVRGDMLGRFYRWCQTYAVDYGLRRRTFAYECDICGNSHYVLSGKRRELAPCPRWNREQKRCVKTQ
jgi:hypothetical protein